MQFNGISVSNHFQNLKQSLNGSSISYTGGNDNIVKLNNINETPLKINSDLISFQNQTQATNKATLSRKIEK